MHALALSLALCCGAEPNDLAGVYSYRSDGEQDRFVGVATIRKVGQGYSVTYLSWVAGGSSNGLPEVVTGAGVLIGDRLSVGWAVPTKEGLVRGVTHYRVTDGRLSGRYFSLPTDGHVRSEELTFLRTLEGE